VSALQNGLDESYLETLVRLARTAPLDGVMLLAHELVHDDAGKALPDRNSFFTANEWVLAVAKGYPDLFIPAVSIHPARPDACDALDAAVADGAAMLKLLPNCQNVNCNDRRYVPFWRRLAHHGLPFLAHTGGELSVPVVAPQYADPRTMTLPLECGVTVIAAHGGTRSLLWDPHYTPVLIEMLTRYPKLYIDNSALNTPFRSGYYAQLLRPEVVTRVVHGSDLPIPISATWPWLRG
jgi:predicted TIM-barrel fold metal-dependent hydrolase